MYYHPKFYMDSLNRNISKDNINMMIDIKRHIIVKKKEHGWLPGIKIHALESNDKEVHIILRILKQPSLFRINNS